MEKEKWRAANNGGGHRNWFVFIDERWIEDGIPRYQQIVAQGPNGRQRRFASYQAAKKAADKLNAAA